MITDKARVRQIICLGGMIFYKVSFPDVIYIFNWVQLTRMVENYRLGNTAITEKSYRRYATGTINRGEVFSKVWWRCKTDEDRFIQAAETLFTFDILKGNLI